MTVSDLISALTQAIDHYSGPGVLVHGTASATDQRAASDFIKSLTAADAANTAALAAVTTAQISGPAITAAHDAWAAQVAIALAAKNRSARAASLQPSPAASAAAGSADASYRGLLASEPPGDVSSAVAAAQAKQRATLAALNDQIGQASSYLDYLSVS